MLAPLRRIGSLAAVAALCAGCSFDAFTYTVDRYGTATARQVHLGCHDTYEIYDRPDAGLLLAITNGLNEALASACDGPGIATLPKEERLRRAAHIYLEETTDRPLCRITRETAITDLHTEFAYRCPAPGTPTPRVAAPPRLRRG